MLANLSSPPFSIQVTSSLWDSSDASGHSGELCLVDALQVSVFFWFLVGGCLVLACLDLVLPLAIDPRQPQESGLSVAGDNFEDSLERRVWPLWGTLLGQYYLDLDAALVLLSSPVLVFGPSRYRSSLFWIHYARHLLVDGSGYFLATIKNLLSFVSAVSLWCCVATCGLLDCGWDWILHGRLVLLSLSIYGVSTGLFHCVL